MPRGPPARAAWEVRPSFERYWRVLTSPQTRSWDKLRASCGRGHGPRAMVRAAMDRSSIDALVASFGAQEVIERVSPYVTPARQARIDAVVSQRIAGVCVAIESPSDPHNAAAVVRTAEALGVLEVHVIAAQGRALHAKRTTQGAFHWVDTHHHAQLPDFLAHHRSAGRGIFGAAMDGALDVEEIPVDRPLCLLLGNESRGLSQPARTACDQGFRVPMVGMSESLNLSVCAAISLYSVVRRHRANVGDSDLSADRLQALRARYYVRSVDDRLIAGLFADRGPSKGNS